MAQKIFVRYMVKTISDVVLRKLCGLFFERRFGKIYSCFMVIFTVLIIRANNNFLRELQNSKKETFSRQKRGDLVFGG